MNGWLREAAQPQCHRRPLDTYPGGSGPSAEAKWFPRSCHAENGGTRQRPGSVPARKFFPVLAPRATLIPSVRGLRRTRRNENSEGLRIGLHESSQGTYAENMWLGTRRILPELSAADLRCDAGASVVSTSAVAFCTPSLSPFSRTGQSFAKYRHFTSSVRSRTDPLLYSQSLPDPATFK